MADEKSPFHPESMQARFDDLSKKADQIRATSAPLRTQRDKIKNDAQQQVANIDKQIALVEKDLVDIERERAVISRALGGKSGRSGAAE